MPDKSPYRRPTREIQLVDMANRLSQRREGWLVAHVRLSQLADAYRKPSYLRIATETFTGSVNGVEGQLFLLENTDIVFIARSATLTVLETLLSKIRILFSDDPALREAPSSPRAFASIFDLGRDEDFDAFMLTAQTILQEAEARRKRPPPPPPPGPVASSMLPRIDSVLGGLDVSNLVRRQTICSIFERTPPQPLFEELYVSIDDLEHAVTPGIELTSDPWLFRYLTQTLDQRVMAMLMRNGIKTERPFSLNLNVATILSPAFTKFETIVTSQLRGRLVIEMNKLDVFADMGAFCFARDYLHDHGFRICLDGLTHHTLPFYDRDRLGFDLIKINWMPDSLDTMLTDNTASLRAIVRETGQAHAILCRCEDARAIEVGQDLGIVMFQGRQVDRMLRGF